MSSILALPPELLLEIFGYLPPEDLLDNVQNVCLRWRGVARHPSLWEDFVYSPQLDVSFEDVVGFVEKCPMLKHINVYIGAFSEVVGPDDFVSAVTQKCSNMRTFCVVFYDYFTISHVNALFDAFPNLEHLKMSIDAPNASEIVDRISKCSKLKKLTVQNEFYRDGFIKLIVDGCVSLEYLEFDCPNILEKDFYYVMENMKDRLSYVKFSINQPATQTAVDLFCSFTKLENLDLHHYQECGQVNFLPLANIKTLKCLAFTSATEDISDVDTIFDALFRNPFPHLQSLTIRMYCCNWGRTVLKDICQKYPNVECLDLCFDQTDSVKDTFEDIYKLERLENLIYQHNGSITDDDAAYLVTCRKLKHLDLEGCTGLTDEAVVYISNCRSLETLNLSFFSLSGRSLYLIPENLHRLRFVEIFGTEADLKHLDLLRNKMPLGVVKYR